MFDDDVDFALVAVAEVKEPRAVVEQADLAVQLHRDERLVEHATEDEVCFDPALVRTDEVRQQAGVGDVDLGRLIDLASRLLLHAGTRR